MKITIMYPQLLDTGKNSETIIGISNFKEKTYGISFELNEGYMFIAYNHIIGFFLTEDDKNDSRRMQVGNY